MKHTEETKLKISLSKIGHRVSDETKEKLSKIFTGRPSPMTGRHHSEAAKRKMSMNRKGKGTGKANHNYHRKFSAETLEKMSRSAKAHAHVISEETKRRISEACKKSDKVKRNLERLHKAQCGVPMPAAIRAKLSFDRMGEKCPTWKGGRIIDSRGYVRVKQKNPQRTDKNHYVLEHRLIAERALGRPLKRTEPVHHHNEIRADNKNGNLVICQDEPYHKLIHRRMKKLQALEPK